MLLVSLLLPFILGALLIRLVHPKSSIIEIVGLSFLVGIFFETTFMIALDACSISITRLPIITLNVLLVSLLTFLLWKRGDRFTYPKIAYNRFLTSLKSINAVWMLLVIFIVWFEYLNLEKCLFFPTFDRDSLTSFDTIGFVLAQEHTYKGLSLFDVGYIPNIKQAGSTIEYAPFVQLSYGYVYLFGAETSKLIPALLFLSFIVSFYTIMTRCVKKTGAALVTLMMLLTPQMLAFSSLSATNVIHATFASLGTLYGLLWLRSQHKGDLILSALLLAANNWTRYEGIVFILALGVPIVVNGLKKKAYKPILTWAFIAATPFLFWTIYQQLTGLHTDKGFLITRLFWDSQKMGLIGQSLFNHMLNTTNYGWTFYAIPLSLLINLWYVITKRDNLTTLLVLFGGLILYGMILYQIDYTWDPIQNVLAYSAKRFLFCFVPIAWFYVATNRAVSSGLIRVDEWLTFSKNNQSLPA